MRWEYYFPPPPAAMPFFPSPSGSPCQRDPNPLPPPRPKTVRTQNQERGAFPRSAPHPALPLPALSPLHPAQVARSPARHLPVDGIFISLEGVVDGGAHGGGHGVGVGGVRVLVRVQRRPVVQVVDGLHGAGAVGVPVHGGGDAHPLHAAVVGQLVVLRGRESREASGGGGGSAPGRAPLPCPTPGTSRGPPRALPGSAAPAWGGKAAPGREQRGWAAPARSPPSLGRRTNNNSNYNKINKSEKPPTPKIPSPKFPAPPLTP